MKSLDFTKPGKMPGSQDRMAYLQTAYTEVLKALSEMGGDGTIPFVISGMAVSGGGNTVSNGWFYYNGVIVKFTGGTVAPIGTDVALVLIASSAAPLTYNDGSTPAVILETAASLISGATLTDATHLPVSALLPFGVGLGANNRESTWQTIAIATAAGVGGVVGNIYYKKDFINNTLLIKGNLTANNAVNLNSIGSANFTGMCNIPAGYRPAADSYFLAYLPATISDQDDLSSTYLSVFPCLLNTGGNFYIKWLKPLLLGSYPISFHAVISLD